MGGQSERTEAYLEYIPENVEEQPSERWKFRKDVGVLQYIRSYHNITSISFYSQKNEKGT